jgi:hypothetical protein
LFPAVATIAYVGSQLGDSSLASHETVSDDVAAIFIRHDPLIACPAVLALRIRIIALVLRFPREIFCSHRQFFHPRGGNASEV